MDFAHLVQAGERSLTRAILHFFLIGAALFALERGLGPRAVDREREVVVVRATEVERRVRDWTEETGRAPAAEEREALVEAAIDDEVLFRTALRLGLHETDGVVARRLAENMRFVGGNGAAATDLRRRALSLGMEKNDLVVRRRLVELVGQWLRTGAQDPPDEAAIDDYLGKHLDRFAPVERVSFAQLFLSRQARGASLESDATVRLEDLRTRRAGPSEACHSGDPALMPCEVPPSTSRDIERFFGSELAARVPDLPEGVWAGPISSPYGLHLVWVRSRKRESPPADELRAAVRALLARERAEAAIRDGTRVLRRRFVVRVEDRVLAGVNP